jgi:microcystin-dependent protein
MPILTITKHWASGAILFEADLDFIKNDLEEFFNVTGIDDDNLQDVGITASDKIVDATIGSTQLQGSLVTTSKIADDAVTTVKIADGSLEPEVFAADVIATVIPPGTMWEYAGSSAPTNWLLCDGSAISRTTYVALFTALGTSYGAGNGSTTFNIPDCRGRVRAGKDDMGGVSANRLTSATMSPDGSTRGATGGTETQTLTAAQVPPHHHTVGATTSTGTLPAIITPPFNPNTVNTATDTHTHTFSVVTPNTLGGGTGSAHNNTQPSVIMNVIIRT